MAQGIQELLSFLEEGGCELKTLGHFQIPHALTVSVNLRTRLVYLPLEIVDGQPILKVMKPTSLP